MGWLIFLFSAITIAGSFGFAPEGFALVPGFDFVAMERMACAAYLVIELNDDGSCSDCRHTDAIMGADYAEIRHLSLQRK